jgi:adenylosuccinate synthase
MDAYIIIDLGYGDAGKGSLVDFIAREKNIKTVIRFNGGAQAAHNVIAPDGRHHTFSQFGSATFLPDAETFLSRFMLVDPIAIFGEAKTLEQTGIKDVLNKTAVDRLALITTPFHWAANRLREMARGDARHGSCGKGIGETMSDHIKFGERVPRVGDMENPGLLKEKLAFLQKEKRDELVEVMEALPKIPSVLRESDILTGPDVVDMVANYYERFRAMVKLVDGRKYLKSFWQNGEDVIFEGAQGVLIDEWYGFHPYTTWSTCTFSNAFELLNESGFNGATHRIGALRAYHTRHGAGPFVSEDKELSIKLPEMHNGMDDWQKNFRVGWFDLVAARYALSVVDGADSLALACLDRLDNIDELKVCDGYVLPEISKVRDLFRFNVKNPRVAEEIKVKGELENLDFQERITKQLFQARPRLKNTDKAGYLEFVERELRTKVSIASFGPSAKDKKFLET